MTEQAKPKTSFARIIITPIILLVAGYLVAGLIPGAAVAAVVGIVYIVWASRRWWRPLRAWSVRSRNIPR